MPTCQKSSLNGRMNLTKRENAGVFTLMGLTQHHHSNAIHELLRSECSALSFQHISRSKTAALDEMGWFLFNISASRQETNNKAAIKRRNISVFLHHLSRIHCVCRNGTGESSSMLFIAQSLLNLLTKIGLLLFSWNQENTHTPTHVLRQTLIPPSSHPFCSHPSWTMTIPFTLAICHPWSD